MRRKIIAIGILAVIAICATLAIANTPPTKININTDGAKVVFLNATAGSQWKIISTDISTDDTKAFKDINGTIGDDGHYAYYVIFGNCSNITPSNSTSDLECVNLVPNEYNVSAWLGELNESGSVNVTLG